MSDFVVSARRYRPVTFSSVVGQEHITTTLKNSIHNNKLAQAFLFCGPRGVGKTTCARILARTINCTNLTDDTEACGQCESCQSFNNSNSMNIFELDAASNNGVDAIRSLIEEVRIPPQTGRYKVYIIDEVHMLSQAAFNAFLKTLEEPPTYAKFIMATTEKSKVLPTILSRCQVFDFKRIGIDDIFHHLEYVARQENVTYEEEALRLIAKKSDGGLRDALSTFDQLVSFTSSNLTLAQCVDTLHVLDSEVFLRLVEAFRTNNISSALLLYEEILAKGFDGQPFLTGLSEYLRNLMVSLDSATHRLLEVSEGVASRLGEQAAACGLPRILYWLDVSSDYEYRYREAVNKRLFVEVALMKMAAG